MANRRFGWLFGYCFYICGWIRVLSNYILVIKFINIWDIKKHVHDVFLNVWNYLKLQDVFRTCSFLGSGRLQPWLYVFGQALCIKGIISIIQHMTTDTYSNKIQSTIVLIFNFKSRVEGQIWMISGIWYNRPNTIEIVSVSVRIIRWSYFSRLSMNDDISTALIQERKWKFFLRQFIWQPQENYCNKTYQRNQPPNQASIHPSVQRNHFRTR